MSKQVARKPVHAVSGLLAKKSPTRPVHRTLDDMHMQIVGDRIRRRMEALGITSAQLAVDIQVPRKTVEAWMRGRHLPKPLGLAALSRGLRMNPSTIIAGA